MLAVADSYHPDTIVRRRDSTGIQNDGLFTSDQLRETYAYAERLGDRANVVATELMVA